MMASFICTSTTRKIQTITIMPDLPGAVRLVCWNMEYELDANNSSSHVVLFVNLHCSTL
jgi:hypothetical protein